MANILENVQQQQLPSRGAYQSNIQRPVDTFAPFNSKQVGPSIQDQMASLVDKFGQAAFVTAQQLENKALARDVVAAKIDYVNQTKPADTASKIHKRAYNLLSVVDMMKQDTIAEIESFKNPEVASMSAEEYDKWITDKTKKFLDDNTIDENVQNMYANHIIDVIPKLKERQAEANKAYVLDQNTALINKVIATDVKRYQLNDLTKEELFKSLDDKVSVNGTGQAILGVPKDAMLSSIVTQAYQMALDGDDSLLSWVEKPSDGILSEADLGKYSDGIQDARRKFDVMMDARYNMTRTNSTAEIYKAVEAGIYNRSMREDFQEKYPDVFSEKEWARFELDSLRNAAKQEDDSAGINAYLLGTAGWNVSGEARQEVADKANDLLMKEYFNNINMSDKSPENLNRINDAIDKYKTHMVDLIAKNGYKVNKIASQLQAAFTTLPDTSGKLPQFTEEAFDWVQRLHANPQAQWVVDSMLGDAKTAANVRVIHDMVVDGGMTLQQAVQTRRDQLQIKNLPKESYKNIEKQVQGYFEDLTESDSWFGKDARYTAKVYSDLHTLAKNYIEAGYALNPKQAAQMAMSNIKARSEKVLGERIMTGGKVSIAQRMGIPDNTSVDDVVKGFIKDNKELIARGLNMDATDVKDKNIRVMMAPGNDGFIFLYSDGAFNTPSNIPVPFSLIGAKHRSEVQAKWYAQEKKASEKAGKVSAEVQQKMKAKLANFKVGLYKAIDAGDTYYKGIPVDSLRDATDADLKKAAGIASRTENNRLIQFLRELHLNFGAPSMLGLPEDITKEQEEFVANLKARRLKQQ